MAFRGNESPMDFKWSSDRPTDPSSPFAQVSTRNLKRKTDPKSIFSNLNLPVLTAQGSQTNNTTFDSQSPNKVTNSFQQSPSRPFLFGTSSAKSVPTFSPYKDSSFTTPRKAYDLDFSSGPESSPMVPTDNDETPDGKPLPSVPASKSKKRNSLFNFYGRWAPGSSKSGRGEMAKPKVLAETAPKRVQKKRRQAQTFEKQLARVRKESDPSDNELDTPLPKKRKASSQKQSQNHRTEDVSWIAGLFAFIHQYPDAPSIIAKYLQVFFNAVILFSVLYVAYGFVSTIRADVDRASNDEVQAILSEMAACAKNYMDNRCEGAQRAPALENVCANWELCMNRDPNAVKRARLSAHTFAEIFNSFVEPISLKTMAFSSIVVALALLVNNATFTIYRRSQEHEAYRYPSHPYGMQHGANAAHVGQFGMTPALPYQTPHQYGWQLQDQDQDQRQLTYEDSPIRDRAKARSPEKQRLLRS